MKINENLAWGLAAVAVASKYVATWQQGTLERA